MTAQVADELAGPDAGVDPRDPGARLTALLDPGSIGPLPGGVGAEVRAVRGRVNGTRVVAYCSDATRMGGALGSEGALRIVAAIDRAVHDRCPVIGLWHSGGAKLADGVESMDGVGQMFAAMTRASGRVPQVSVVLGPAAGAAAYGPALTDLIVMAPEGRMFVTGPDVVRSVTGEQIDMAGLGGGEAHGRRSGVVHVQAESTVDAYRQARQLTTLLARPGLFDITSLGEPDDLAALLPASARRAYDVRPLVHRLLDPDGFVELQPKWAPNMVVGLGRLGGRTVGVLANNPLRKGGCLNSLSAEKASRFVRLCDAFGVPLVVLVDVPGYLPGVREEWDGVLRRGAKLLHAFAASVVPRVTLVTRKSYGGAYIAMNSRSLGATAVLAWPGAEIAVMGAETAVGVLHRKVLAATAPADLDAVRAGLIERQRREAGGVDRAVALGVVDEVIEPAHTRRRVAETLVAAPAGRGHHTNIPREVGDAMAGTVLIAGGGPTGLMLAAELRLAGVDATLLEPRTERPETSAGMAVHGRTLELFKHRGFDDQIAPGTVFPWPRTPFSLLWLEMSGAAERDFTYAFPQWRTERLLADRAVALGADLRLGHRLTGFRQDGDGVVAEVTGPDGAYQLRADYLVGCDGAESLVRTLAGIGFQQISESYYGLYGDMELVPGQAFDAGVHPGGVFGAVPLSADVIRLMTLEFAVDRPADAEPATKAELAAAIGRITGTEPELGTMRSVARFGAPTRLAEAYRAGRVFLAGDAAHSLFVSGTQALNTGIHDAMNLGWKLAATLHGWAPDGLLDTYHGERYPAGERMAWHAHASMALLHPLDRVGQLRDLVGRLLRFDEVNRHFLQITTNVRYPVDDSGAPAAAAHPLLGHSVPDTALVTATGAGTVSGTLRAGHGVLLVLGEDSAAAELAAGWSGRVDVVTAKPTPELAAAVLLIRPDGYVAHADAAGTDRDGLDRALRRWFGENA
jgi:acetyl-CoA/propionyl-CoA carboxylase carboxyl transferase subunit